MFQQILAPLDGSRASFNAFDWAVAIARPEEALITALCVIDVRVSHEAQVYLPGLGEMKLA
jgi:nucleotide-binding universal stress UspA family protein